MSNKKNFNITSFPSAKKRKAGKVPDSTYKSAAKVLRKYHKFSFDLRGKLTSHEKAAITKQYKKLKGFVSDIQDAQQRAEKGSNVGQRTRFVKFKTEAEKKRAIKVLGKNAVTNTGFLMKTPHRSNDPTTGDFEASHIKLKTGKQTRLIYPIGDKAEFMLNPQQYISEYIIDNYDEYGDCNEVGLAINGYSVANTLSPSQLNAFFGEYEGTDLGNNVNGFILYYFE